MTLKPRLAVVVIGFRAPASLVDAVRSLLDQAVPLEIVVVNSGGGDTRSLLAGAGLAATVIEIQQPVFVGAARNAGIAATAAPFVAFLADDCAACPGWAEARLRRHSEGAAAVSGAMVNSDPANPVACAAHLLLFASRLPGLPPELAVRYGTSFDRRLFEKFGLFDGSMRIAEDTEFLERLPEDLQPVWEPDVKTVHRNETRLFSLLADQYGRGYRYGAYIARAAPSKPMHLARTAFSERRQIRELACRGLSGAELAFAMRSMPIVRLALLAKSAGVYVGAWRHRRKVARR